MRECVEVPRARIDIRLIKRKADGNKTNSKKDE